MTLSLDMEFVFCIIITFDIHLPQDLNRSINSTK